MKLRPALIGIASTAGGSQAYCPSTPLPQTLIPRWILCGLMLGLITSGSCTFRHFELPFVRVRNENRARTFKDFDGYYPKGPYRLDFKIGDRFRLKKPMFLHYSITGIVELTPPAEQESPKVGSYLADPGAYAFGGNNGYQIIRLAPQGTIIRLVSIKDSSQAGFLTYFVFVGEDEWFRSSMFRKWTEEVDKPHSYTHDHEYFTKLPAR